MHLPTLAFRISLPLLLLSHSVVTGQSLGNAGTIRASILDPSGAPISAAQVELSNAVTGLVRRIDANADGSVILQGVPQGSYRLRVTSRNFEPYSQDVAVRSSVPANIVIRLAVAGQSTSVTVASNGGALVESVPVASQTVDRRLLTSLPLGSPNSALNDAITFTAPGVAADSNGFFHPLGDHAQVSYVVDGQPISDQRNKVFSTSLPANAIQSMEVIAGLPPAEYGDKTSLVINAVTRSGLGQRPTGSLTGSAGSFGSFGEEATLGLGSPRVGNFLVFNSERTGRFLDTPEFRPIHDRGNTGTFFNRTDLQPNGRDAFHLNLLAARNWTQVPNTYDQPNQDQRQKVLSFNIAPGYQRTFDAKTLFSANAFVRRDHVNYYPSRDPLADSPATLSQDRFLTNYGLHSDIARIQGKHNLKVGLNIAQTRLTEQFSLGITDPLYNAVCLTQPASIPVIGFTATSQCAAAAYAANPDFLSGLAAYDLSRGGSLYRFNGKANIFQAAFFVQDSYTLGALTLNLGIRFDQYNGLTHGGGLQPRGALAYLFKQTGTVLRGGYSHTLETPQNENLVASSSTGSGGLASNLYKESAEEKPIALGSRNQYDAGVQQGLGRWLVVDVSYFRKYTRNAFDFDALFSTPITFPIGWKQSKLDGVAARLTMPDFHGFRAFATMGHANARFFGPENGGIVFNSNLTIGAYRQDHDQVYQQNVNLHYGRPKNGWWADFIWRYDSGLVVGAVNGMEDALALTAAEQSAIGLYCGANRASLSNRLAACGSPMYGAERIHILAPGTENDDHNPPRTKSRHLFNLAIGTDNLLRKERLRTTLRFSILNLSNQASLYNFLSPFSGTHWVAPRTYQAQFGFAF